MKKKVNMATENGVGDDEFAAAMNVGKPKPALSPKREKEAAPTGEHRVVPRVVISPRQDYVPAKSDHRRKPNVHVVRFSPDGRVLGCALSNGRIAVYDTKTGRSRYNMDSADPRHKETMWFPDEDAAWGDAGKGEEQRDSQMTVSPLRATKTPVKSGDKAVASLEVTIPGDEEEYERPAVVAMRWFPTKTCNTDGHYKLLSANSDGVIQRWRITSPNDPEMVTYRSERLKRTGTEIDDGDYEDTYDFDGTRCVESIMFASGYDSSALGLDYDSKGERFAAACKDAVVRVFDNETSKVISTLDGGMGADFQVESEYMLMGDMQRFYSVMERRRLKKASAMEVINKVNVNRTSFELNRENVTMKKRHSNRVYGCKFTTGHTQITDNLIGSAGWDGTLQLWDLRQPGPAVKSYYGAFIAGDALDIVGNDMLTGSHRYENQLQIYDLRFDAAPKTLQVVEGNLLYCAAFSKGNVDTPERFFCAGGMGPGKAYNDLTIFDHKRDNQVAAVVQELPGGVVSVDWDPLHTHPLEVKSPINSSKGSVPGGILAIGCGDSSIRIVEVCTARSSKFIDDAEEEVEDGEETDSELFEGYMDTKYGDDPEALKRVRVLRSEHVGIPLPQDSPLSAVRRGSSKFQFSTPTKATIILGKPGDQPLVQAINVASNNAADTNGNDHSNGKILLTSQSAPVLSPRAEQQGGEDDDEDREEEGGNRPPPLKLGPPKATNSKALAAPVLSPVLSPQANGNANGTAQEDSASASHDEFAVLNGTVQHSGEVELDQQIDDFLEEN